VNRFNGLQLAEHAKTVETVSCFPLLRTPG